jgi:PAS domain S-box-containing protein
MRVKAYYEDRMIGSSDHFQMVLSANRAGVWEYDHASGASTCSSEVFKMLGRAEGELPNKLEGWLELVHPEDRGHVLDRMPTEDAADDYFHEAEFRLRGSDSQWICVHCRGRVIERDARGKPLRTAGLILDISKWHANRSELAEFIPVGFYTMCYYVSDSSFHFLYLNDQFCKITGLEKAALLNDARLAFASALPEDRIRLDEANLKSATSGEPFLFEGRFTIRGQLRWLRIESRPTFRLNGDSEWNGIVVDITDLKFAHEALRESEERFRALAEMSPESILVNLKGRYVYANQAAVRLLRARDASEIIGLSPFDLIAPGDHERVRERMRLVIDEKQILGAREAFWARLDGSRVTVEVATGPIIWQGEQAIQVVSRDITERKQIEKTLQDADRRKDEFLATLAHELRNPLAPIRNGLHVLRRYGTEGLGAEKLLPMMERQVEHLVRLVDDLIEISRISKGKIELKKERCDLAGILRDAIETSRPHIEAADQRLIVELPSSPVTLDADPVRLAQVFANLLNNAAKYSDEGGRIWLKAGQVGEEALVSVRDEGAGIEADMLPRVFDLFAQANGVSRHGRGGLGVGLALARGLVQLHGGSAFGYSDGPGQGSEFTVRLPMDAAIVAGAECAENAAAAPERCCRVLVVDDDRDVGDSLGILLKCIGVDALVTYGGAAAIVAITEFKPHLAFIDVGMPGMDGYETARRIRALPEGKNITLVALTGWGQAGDRQRALEAGFDQHFVKPIEVGALESLLASTPVRP